MLAILCDYIEVLPSQVDAALELPHSVTKLFEREPPAVILVKLVVQVRHLFAKVVYVCMYMYI